MPNIIDTEVLRSKDHGSSVPDAISTSWWCWTRLPVSWNQRMRRFQLMLSDSGAVVQQVAGLLGIVEKGKTP